MDRSVGRDAPQVRISFAHYNTIVVRYGMMSRHTGHVLPLLLRILGMKASEYCHKSSKTDRELVFGV